MKAEEILAAVLEGGGEHMKQDLIKELSKIKAQDDLKGIVDEVRSKAVVALGGMTVGCDVTLEDGSVWTPVDVSVHCPWFFTLVPKNGVCDERKLSLQVQPIFILHGPTKKALALICEMDSDDIERLAFGEESDQK